MKIIGARILSLVGLLCLPTLAFGSTIGSFSIGLQGVGSQWSDGKPTFRWRIKDKVSYDLTPTLRLTNGSSTGTGSSNSSSQIGLAIGRIRKVGSIADLNIGVRTELGYTYIRSKTGYSSGSLKNTGFSSDFSVGPDLEYFISAVPGLSIGAQAVIAVTYVENTSRQKTFSTGLTQTSVFKSTEVELVGQVLTVRYYFGSKK